MLPVSVIIPAKNEASNIGRLLESLFGQTKPPAEVIVVDAGSTDETAQIAASHGARVLRVDHAYPGQARNLGVMHAKYDIIAFWDAGMYLERDTLEKLCAPIIADEADWCSGDLKIKPQTFAASLHFLLLNAPYTHRLDNHTVAYIPPVACAAFKKVLWEKVKGFRPWRAREDGDFRQRVEALSPRIRLIPEAITYWTPDETWLQLFRKARIYARHNLLSGSPEDWYGSLVKIYGSYAALALIATLFGGIGVGLAALGLSIIGGGGIRALRRIILFGALFTERTGKKAFSPQVILGTWGLLLLTDTASFLGGLDWLVLDKVGLNPERFPEPSFLEELSPTLLK